MPWPNTGYTATRRRRKPGWSQCAITCSMPASARSAKSSTVRRRTIHAVRRPKPGRWPAYWRLGSAWSGCGYEKKFLVPEPPAAD